jgi:hypothetical protein
MTDAWALRAEIRRRAYGSGNIFSKKDEKAYYLRMNSQKILNFVKLISCNWVILEASDSPPGE